MDTSMSNIPSLLAEFERLASLDAIKHTDRIISILQEIIDITENNLQNIKMDQIERQVKNNANSTAD